MLSFNSDQLAALEAEVKSNEPDWAIALLRRQHASWCMQHSPEEIQKFCADTLTFAHRCDLHSKSSLQCLLELRVMEGMPSPFSDWQKLLLTRKGFTEETRLAQFMETLSGTDRPVLISLKTDLGAMGL